MTPEGAHGYSWTRGGRKGKNPESQGGFLDTPALNAVALMLGLARQSGRQFHSSTNLGKKERR
jgi:hypothetical protein